MSGPGTGEPNSKGSRTIGLALGSGAARGLSYIGALDTLENHDIEIDLLAGTSIGALIGALFASGVPVRQMEQVACSLNWRRLARLLDPILPTSGLLDGKKVARFIDDLLPVKSFEELQRPLSVTTTDVETGELVVIREGNLLKAIQASIAFPGIFTPVRFEKRFLVDGGLCAPVPTDVVKNMGADLVIGLCAIPEVEKRYAEASTPVSKQRSGSNLFFEHFNSEWLEKRFREVWQGRNGKGEETEDPSPPRKPPGIFRVFAQSVAIMENQINSLRLEQDQIDLLIRPDLKDINLLEFHRAGEIIGIGKKATAEALRKYGMVP